MKDTRSLAADSAFIPRQLDRTLLKALTKDSAELSIRLLLVRLLGTYVTKYDLPHPFKVVLPFQLILVSIMTPLGPPPPNPLTLPLFHSNLKFLILTSLLLTQLKFHGQSLRSPPRIHSHSTSVFASWYLLSKPSALVSPVLYLVCPCTYAAECGWTKPHHHRGQSHLKSLTTSHQWALTAAQLSCHLLVHPHILLFHASFSFLKPPTTTAHE